MNKYPNNESSSKMILSMTPWVRRGGEIPPALDGKNLRDLLFGPAAATGNVNEINPGVRISKPMEEIGNLSTISEGS